MDPVTILLGLGSKLIDRFFPDAEKAAEAKLELFKMQMSGELAQMTAQTDINKVEAANPRLFVSGARPFIMWVCGLGCAWNWLGLPICIFISHVINHPIDVSQANLTEMMPLLMGMLGLGSMRTFEKLNGVASK